ncbi:hypothetical protein FIM10_03780 [Sphingomonadales bacterium 56]|jgi:ElaB/YqjD/DUF883 family membrane-anchored ribosome-binding protein|uniref:hypothetical protein n=1 Tax=unclassified Sphingobium TaxID=2611147 RepID=UPI00191B0A16|nr:MULTISPECIES: hypothetical protein [unclassified Sphingobium]MBY2927795.1 hypothetical protein [Sphingomonadales bacterium 56]MBY2957895.1 hypothetical protein [Sphingomonadales bacterium 58]CAD7335952.1 hypothetical protein SPHS6_00766 [Sphingobium sp. S6]CAD7336015.1 hypothetical protein SPHS8_00806 [Sphingobium sp. S8]
MADTPETPPTKRTKKAAPAEPAKGAPVATREVTPTAPIKTAATKPGNGAASQGWSAQIAPLKEQAEKAARTAADKLNSVDWKTHIDPLKDQATKTALSAAGVAKDKTGTAMQSLAKLITDTAGTVDAKLGPQYGDYARQAAEAVAGAADTLDSKDVDQLMAEAKDFVRKSPAVAIGAAAVVGFVLMRLAKGSDDKA